MHCVIDVEMGLIVYDNNRQYKPRRRPITPGGVSSRVRNSVRGFVLKH